MSRETLAAAARRAREQGVGAEEILIAESLIDKDFYYRALAARLNCPFIDRAAALASGFDYRAALRASVARADPDREDFDWLLAPRGAQIVDLLKLSDARKRIAVCAPKFFSALARAKGRQALSEDASFALSRADASLSANAPQVLRSRGLALILSAIILVGLLPVSTRLLGASSLLLSALFLGGVYFPWFGEQHGQGARRPALISFSRRSNSPR